MRSKKGSRCTIVHHTDIWDARVIKPCHLQSLRSALGPSNLAATSEEGQDICALERCIHPFTPKFLLVTAFSTEGYSCFSGAPGRTARAPPAPGAHRRGAAPARSYLLPELPEEATCRLQAGAAGDAGVREAEEILCCPSDGWHFNIGGEAGDCSEFSYLLGVLDSGASGNWLVRVPEAARPAPARVALVAAANFSHLDFPLGICANLQDILGTSNHFLNDNKSKHRNQWDIKQNFIHGKRKVNLQNTRKYVKILCLTRI
ncbi:uncharacterized protein LOC129146944 [Talpa occidentalis]|uniref:uncharacterized protein LOC129146944 n=1 Tax=Talpa occidentalis TaxID=50954 RepID=UPI0023F90DFA|nr:uncharacterized protein LOC129146944 [Talpa occidentalis]